MENTLDNELFQQILKLDEAEKQSVLQMLKAFIIGRENKTGRISIEQYNREINEAVAKVKDGDYFTHEEVERMAEDW